MINSTLRDSCRLCDSPRLELVVPMVPSPISGKCSPERARKVEFFPLDLYICHDCGHVQLLEIVDPTILFDADYSYHSAGTRALLQHFEEVAMKIIAQFALEPGTLVIDVGSNDGSLLCAFQARGMRVLGIDPAAHVAEAATAAGIPTIPAFLVPDLARRIRAEHGGAGVVTAFNVFAHADDLGGLADAIRELLSEDGVFVSEASYLADVIEHQLLGTIFHEHLSYHAVIPLRKFLARHRLELIDVERVSIQGGSIVATAQLAGGRHAIQPSVSQFEATERERGITDPETLRGFRRRLDGLRVQLQALVSEILREGKTIVGYGAARSATTLIAEMGLGSAISFIVDDDPAKQHQFTPGYNLPVLSVSALHEQRAAYAIIFGWVRAEEIIKRNRAFLEQGGRFILCFPTLSVIGAEGPLDLRPA